MIIQITVIPMLCQRNGFMNFKILADILSEEHLQRRKCSVYYWQLSLEIMENVDIMYIKINTKHYLLYDIYNITI